jgi:hypothetical protein
LNIHKPIAAFDGPMYVGTNRLGRPLTPAESRQLGALLREHDLAGARSISLNYARKKTRSHVAAEDLWNRAYVRLVEQGWDPRTVTLAKCLCRFVWSEHTNTISEDNRRRKAEEVFFREQGLDHSDAGVPSVEDFAVRLESERRDEAHAKHRIAALRARFVEADDQINLLWLEYWLSGVEEPGEMARLSNHEPEEFYRAADRRKRHVNRLLAAERGAKFEENE